MVFVTLNMVFVTIASRNNTSTLTFAVPKH